MKAAILCMLIVITMSLWGTWIYVLRNKFLKQCTPITIALIVMTPVTVGYGTYYGL